MICSKGLKSSLLTSFVKLCSERQSVLILDGSHSVPAIGTQHVRTNYTQHSKPDWDKAVSEAEKIVGYPTSFLSLRWLLSDEIANVALHLRKLVGSNHPLLKTAKDVLYSNRHNVQAWGLIVLLISKAAGHASVDALKEDKAAGVLHSQRALAEVTEMIRTSHLVHKGLVNIYPGLYPQPAVLNDMLFGNKIALLGGDYLLGNCCAELASLRNQELVEIMSSSVRDLAEAEFLGQRDMQNNPLPPRFARTTLSLEDYFSELLNTAAVSDWRHRNILSAASLLGSSCKGTLMLADHGPELQQHAFDFGKHLALASQACLELEPFNAMSDSNYATTTERFSLTSAPVLFHLEHDPSLYEEIEKGHKSVNDVDYKKVHEIVSNGPGPALTKELQREHSRCAMNELHVFQENDARTALSNIIVAMEEII